MYCVKCGDRIEFCACDHGDALQESLEEYVELKRKYALLKMEYDRLFYEAYQNQIFNIKNKLEWKLSGYPVWTSPRAIFNTKDYGVITVTANTTSTEESWDGVYIQDIKKDKN